MGLFGNAAGFVKAAAQLEAEKAGSEILDKPAAVATDIAEHINIIKERSAQNRAKKLAAKWAYTFPEGAPKDMDAEDLMKRVNSTVYTTEKAFQKDDFVSKDGSVHRLDVYASKPEPVQLPKKEKNDKDQYNKNKPKKTIGQKMLKVGKITLTGVGIGYGVLQKYNPYLSVNVAQPQMGR